MIEMNSQKFQARFLTKSIIGLMLITAQHHASGSDASIYINPDKATAASTAMFLLDNSGSMTYDSSYDDVTAADGSKDVRINRLKKSMQRVLVGDATGTEVSPTNGKDFKIGLAHFTPAGTGRIAVPALLSKERAVVPSSTGALGATTLFPNSGTFIYYNSRDGVGTRTNDGALEFLNIDTDSNRYWRVDSNDNVYLRFHIDIPKGATITSAKLIVPYINAGTNMAANRVTARFETATNADKLSTSKTVMSGRFTNAGIVASNYVAPANGSGGNLTFELASQLSTLVSQTAWCGMNAVGIHLGAIATNAPVYTFFAAGNADESYQPRLEVTWSITPTVRAATCMGKRTERILNSPNWTTDDYITNLDQMTQRHYVNLEMQRMPGNTGTPTAAAYAETTAYLMGNTTSGVTGSGFSVSTDNAKTVAGTSGTYASPLPPNTGDGSTLASCVGNGIFTLTDGQPNGASGAPTHMNKARGSTVSCTDDSSGWSCILANAKALFPSNANTADDARTTNTRTYPIRSILVGFGDPTFWNGTSTDAANAKLWGSVDYGGGLKTSSSSSTYSTGFASVSSASDVVNVIQRFFDVFPANTGISSNGSGVVPGSFGSDGAALDYVYFPLFDPQLSNPFWKGNVKRYKILKSGSTRSIVDRNNTVLLKSIDQNTPAASAGSLFDPATQDLWNTTGVNDGEKVLEGGLVSKFNQPRRLFVDTSLTGSPIVSGALTQVDYDLDSTTQSNLMSALTTQMAPIDPALSLLTVPTVLTVAQQQGYLKNYFWWLLNHDMPTLAEGVGVANSVRTTTISNQMGGVFHSQPEVMTTDIKATRDADGKLQASSQTDYLIFGTMQGLVHVVGATTGEEQFVFAPTELLSSTKSLLPPANKVVSGTSLIDAPLVYGMDSPWTAYIDRETKDDGTNISLSAKTINVYGGMRMGGSSYYGMDLTGLGKSGFIPKILFKITPSSAGFSNLGQTWSQPIVANIKVSGKTKRVVIFGGGYDSRYEAVDVNGAPTYIPGSSNDKGTAIYIVDAVTGVLIQSISNGSTSSTNFNVSSMNYSIPSAVKLADRDGDGLSDHIYFGDLGGQVFRVDLANYPATGKGLIRRVVKLADFNSTDKVDGVRFYEPPSFAPFTKESTPIGMLTLASGNQSQPMYLKTQDYAFAIFDWDVMSGDLYSRATELTDPNINLTNLLALTNQATKASVSSAISPTTKKGWYFALPSNLVASPTTSTQAASKALVRSTIVDGYMNITTFDPTRNTSNCGAGIKGATTSYRICLPYGVCGNNTLVNIRQTFLGAGVGRPLLAGSLDTGFTYANDSSLSTTTNVNGLAPNALKDQIKFDKSLIPMHRWREVTSEKYK
jgi:type IV pilus assembly protein PilY1